MILKSTRATAERCISFPLIKERTSFIIKPHRSARVRPASPRRNACYTQPNNAREAYPQTQRTTAEVSSASTEKPTTIRVGSTGPVEGAYYKKNWLRILGILGDQNRSQTIDRHASGLRAPGRRVLHTT